MLQSTPSTTVSRLCPDLAMLKTQPYPMGLLGYALQHNQAMLRTMCFVDNEYGDARREEVEAAGLKVAHAVNALLSRTGRRVRVLSISPLPKRHHHIQVQWATIESAEDENGEPVEPKLQLQPIANLNLFPPSKRAQAEEDDGEERVGPRRGETATRKKRSKRAKAGKTLDIVEVMATAKATADSETENDAPVAASDSEAVA